MGTAETWQSQRRLTESEPDPVCGADALGAEPRESDIGPGAEGQPGPRGEFVLRDEDRPPFTVGFGRYLSSQMFQPPERITASRRPGDPGHYAEVVLPEPVAEHGLGGAHVHLLVSQQGPDACRAGHALVPEPVLLLRFIGGHELF